MYYGWLIASWTVRMGCRGFQRFVCKRRYILLVAVLAIVWLSRISTAQTGDSEHPKPEPPDPALLNRPAPKPRSLLIPEGKIKLDVMVDDAAGKPVMGLQPWDFKIVDNGRPTKVLGFVLTVRP